MDVTDFVLGRGGANWGTASGPSWGGGSSVRTPMTTTPVSGAPPAAGMDLTSLTNYINNLNRTAQTSANRARIPQGQALETRSSANIGGELRGEIPPDVIALMQQQAAERGVATGSPGSPNSNAAYLRALGLTSLGLQEQGQRDLTAAEGRNPTAPIFDPSTQLLTPAQSINADLERQRLALEGASIAARNSGGYAGGGYGGGRAPAAEPGMPDEFVANSTATTGATGSILGSLAPDFGRQQWWDSIGYSPTSTATSTAPEGTVTAGGSSSNPIDWNTLFSPGLGIDNSLYQQG